MLPIYEFGSFRLDAKAEVLFRGGAVTEVGRRAVALLRVLVEHPGALLSKEALIEAAWGVQVIEESNLPVQIAALRRVLGKEPGGEQWIETLPRRGYRYIGPAVAKEQQDTAAPTAQASTKHEPEQPSIAVLPFTDLSERSDQRYFGDAIANDIITALTRFRWFFVVARNSSFAFRGSGLDVRQIAKQLGVRYVLEGTHRQVGQRIRITAQLIDATSGSHLWAERYERGLADIFSIQDDITDSVVGAIEPELLKTESRPSATMGGVDSVTAWSLVRRGVWQFHKVERASHEQARDRFREAVKLNPQLAEAHIWLARVSGGIVLWGWSDDPTAVSKEGLEAGMTAIRLDERNPYAYYGLAITSCGANHLQQATRAAMKAIDLSPGFALGHLVLGMAKLYAGQADEAKLSLQNGLRLNSSDPHNFARLDLLACAHLFLGDLDEAIEAATTAINLRPAWRLTLETMAICCAAAERMVEARRYFDAIQQQSAYPSDLLGPIRLNNPRWRDEMENWLQKASGAR
jgi:TolB-like protein/Tfp pilus assembly protein PilF